MSRSPERPPRWPARAAASFGVAVSAAPALFLSAATVGVGVGALRGERDLTALALATASPGVAMVSAIALAIAWPALFGVGEEGAPTWLTLPALYMTLVALVQRGVDSGGYALVRPLDLGRTDGVWREPWALVATAALQVSLFWAMRRKGEP